MVPNKKAAMEVWEGTVASRERGETSEVVRRAREDSGADEWST